MGMSLTISCCQRHKPVTKKRDSIFLSDVNAHEPERVRAGVISEAHGGAVLQVSTATWMVM